ncbi:MAG: tetratricopeptide repeat protein [Chromatiales bacterium]|nr:tetratricopeptide repeat protein [Chromatiales bacterium]
MPKLIEELRRRNVARVCALYLVAGWLLLQIADVLFGLLDVPGWGLRLVLGILILGFPLALIFSWVYEMTPEGLKRESDIDRSVPVAADTGRKLNLVIAGLLAIAVLMLALDRYVPNQLDSGPEPARPATAEFAESAAESGAPAPAGAGAGAGAQESSIAVLPFVNMSRDPDNEYFSDGISEELLNSLANIRGLRVASRTSSFSFKGSNQPIPAIAGQLGVDHVLEGSVRKAGNRVRITAQLIDVSSDSHLWSATYDRELEDIFAVQSEIANSIVSALRVALDTAEANALAVVNSPTQNLDAYSLFLQGRYYIARRGLENLQRGAALLEQALETDPLFDDARVTLAKAYALIPRYSNAADSRELAARANRHLGEVLERDPDNAAALNVSAFIATMYQFDWEKARRLYAKALQLRPDDAEINNFYGDFLHTIGDYEQSEIAERKAMAVDMLAEVHARDLGELMLVLDRPQQAKEFALRALELDPSVEGQYLLIRAHIIDGDFEAARTVIEELEAKRGSAAEAPELANMIMMSWATFHLARGDIESLTPYYLEMRDKAVDNQFSPATAAHYAMEVGGVREALPLLEEAYRQRDSQLTWPLFFLLPETRSTDPAWLEFWHKPGLRELIEIRRRTLQQGGAT